MVKQKDNKKQRRNQGNKARKKRKKNGELVVEETKSRVPKIGPNTPYGMCSERLTAFGGLLALVKFLDLIEFEQLFANHYVSPGRKTKLGGYRMVLGLLMLLFIGFQRIGHVAYIRGDTLLCGILKVAILPAVSTFWRYLQSLTIIQSASMLRLMAALRSKVWRLCEFEPKQVSINIDTTVATVYGKIEGSRKGHNRKHRGKKALRPVLCFIEQTREYLCGTQRRGDTITNKEVARQISQFRTYLPACVKQVLIRGDGEFIGWESIAACRKEGFWFIFGNKRCTPSFSEQGWYGYGDYQYNECLYQPMGWEEACRFVAMRIAKEQKGERQLPLFEEDGYMYRVFVTNLTGKAHHVIEEYDQRADVENSIGEVQREGILAIPSKKFQSNHAFFQVVMLAYNLWRWMKLIAGQGEKEVKPPQRQQPETLPRAAIVDHTIRVARLKLLYLAAKITFHDNRDRVYYSIHEHRAAGILDFLNYLDRRRREQARAA